MTLVICVHKMQRSSTLTSTETMLVRLRFISYAARTTLHARPLPAARRRPNSSWPTEVDGLPTGSRSLAPSTSKVSFALACAECSVPAISDSSFSLYPRLLLWPLYVCNGELDSGLFQHVPRGDGQVNCHFNFSAVLGTTNDPHTFFLQLRLATPWIGSQVRSYFFFFVELLSFLTPLHTCFSDLHHDKLVERVHG